MNENIKEQIFNQYYVKLVTAKKVRQDLEIDYPKQWQQLIIEIEDEFALRIKEMRRIRQLFRNKVKLEEYNFADDDFSTFYKWYIGQYKEQNQACDYCKTKESVVAEFLEGKLHRKRPNRGKHLEIERIDSKSNEYSENNCVLACYFCNNDKSDIFTDKEYRNYLKGRSNFLNSQTIKNNITDKEANSVYFSELLKTQYPKVAEEIEIALTKLGVKYQFIKNTKDIWARDYMPIQVNNSKFVEYRYDPDYLQAKKYRPIKSYPDIICKQLNISTNKTDIILDGGNIIKGRNHVILTDKIFEENKECYSKNGLIEELKFLFEVENIVIIPWDKGEDNKEYLGHSDGMIRFLDDSTVLIQGYYDEYSKEFKENFFAVLKDNNLRWEKLEYNVENQSVINWAYINFLQTKDCILVPKFGIEEDAQALEQFKRYFPDYLDKQFAQINMSEIVNKGGGALNCISWTIQE